MLQSQVKPSHCCKHTPWLEHESSWHVVLGPANKLKNVKIEKKKLGGERKKQQMHLTESVRSPACSQPCASLFIDHISFWKGFIVHFVLVRVDY